MNDDKGRQALGKTIKEIVDHSAQQASSFEKAVDVLITSNPVKVTSIGRGIEVLFEEGAKAVIAEAEIPQFNINPRGRGK